MNTYHRPPREPDIKAQITFLATEGGGKSKPAMSGYRPSHNMGIDGILNDAQHEYIGKEQVYPGETVNTYLWFLSPEYQEGRLYSGMEFTVQEGNWVVGNGVITEVLNEKLSKNA